MLLSQKIQESGSKFKRANQWLQIVFGACLALPLTLGCEQKPIPSNDVVEEEVEAPDPLVVLMIGEPNLGQRVSRQWSARRDGKLTIIDQTVEEFEANEFAFPSDVDVVIYPPAMMGELVSRDRVRALPNDFLVSDEYNKNGLLRHFRVSVVRHRNESWAVPLGGPNFAMLTNRKLFETISPPETWRQMDRTLKKIAAAVAEDSSDSKFQAKVDMPLAKGWAIQTFLARVAPAICFRGKLSTVFDRSTMNPLITEPPFVDALKQLTAIASERSSELDPAAVFELANRGRSSIAFSWPALGFNFVDRNADLVDGELDSGTDDEIVDTLSSQDVLKIQSLPGIEKWYDQKSGTWFERDSGDNIRVDLVGFSGLVASVSSASANERSAWGFLMWLPDKSISKLTMVESPVAGPFRASHLGDMGRWTGEDVSENVAFEYADVITNNHDRSMTLMFPRIPGYSQYVATLDEAVRSAILGQQSPEDALATAAKKWDEITNTIGRDQQIGDLRKESGL